VTSASFSEGLADGQSIRSDSASKTRIKSAQFSASGCI
jgi:hypothetical protein